MSDTKNEVHSLITKAEKAPAAQAALHFSQAALNAAQALRALEDIRLMQRDSLGGS